MQDTILKNATPEMYVKQEPRERTKQGGGRGTNKGRALVYHPCKIAMAQWFGNPEFLFRLLFVLLLAKLKLPGLSIKVIELQND